jgi:hypothetical protein
MLYFLVHTILTEIRVPYVVPEGQERWWSREWFESGLRVAFVGAIALFVLIGRLMPDNYKCFTVALQGTSVQHSVHSKDRTITGLVLS